MPLRVAAISFLNPAPLLYNFEHEPTASALRDHYTLHYTSPAQCAAELHAGNADLGLIPIAALTPELAIIPGCAIASLHEVRSILLLVRNCDRLTRNEALRNITTIAVDAASRSSQTYAHIILEQWFGADAIFVEQQANPIEMIKHFDAALLIGDAALLAREHRAEVEDAAESDTVLWLDLAQLWREHTGLPWVAAVWAVCPEALDPTHRNYAHLTSQQLTNDLIASRDAGLAHIDRLVEEWTPRLELSPETIRTYLTHNIHYTLDADCLRAIELFRSLAAEIDALPPLPTLNLLQD